MGFRERMKELGSAMAKSYIKDKFAESKEFIDYCLKRPELFKECFNELPEYKRRAIIDLVSK